MNSVNYTGRDRFFKLINSLLLALVIASIILPVAYILIASFMDPNVLINQGISFNAKDWTMQGYLKVIADPVNLNPKTEHSKKECCKFSGYFYAKFSVYSI